MSPARRAAAPPSGIGARRATARRDATEAYQQRRHEIAAAAAKVFHRLGYQATTIGAVADEMGVDRASLYYYISSKEELFDEVVREVSEGNVALAEQVRDSDASATDKLRTLITALMSSYAENYPILYVYIREDLRSIAGDRSAWSRHMRSLNRRYDDAITAIVQAGIDDGTIRPAPRPASSRTGSSAWSAGPTAGSTRRAPAMTPR